MKRREFIAIVAGATSWPFTARPQTAKRRSPLIGWLGAGSRRTQPRLFEAFLQELRELGYVEGQTIAMEVREAKGRQERLPELAAELVRLEVDVLVANTSGGVKAAINATRTIPIVMAAAADPVGLGYVASLARPGGNVTGPSYMSTDIIVKRLELLKEVVPTVARVAVLKNSTNPAHTILWQEIEVAAQKFGLDLQPLEARRPEDFEAAFATATRGNVGALLAFNDSLTFAHRSRVASLAAAYRLPAMYGSRDFPDAGGLMSYGTDVINHYRHVAKFVDKILKGANASELAIEQPTKFDLVINLKAAKALDLTIPPTVLARADEVIE